jgi:protein-S-isoprenylcysteine O-methyltransferase Ste14
MRSVKIMPTTCLLMAIVAMIAIHFVLPVARVIPPLWNMLGILPLAVGIVLNLIADAAFHKAQTTVKPFQESSALIMDGVFRLSRNPMYLGFVLILIGIAILLGSLTPFAIILVFVILIDSAYVTVEERMLAEKFGAKWEEYKRRTRRWL